jgi:hypothetical protein
VCLFAPPVFALFGVKKSDPRARAGSRPTGNFFNFKQGRATVRISTRTRSSGAQDEFSASVLFLSSVYMVAPLAEGLPGFDGVACRTPLLRARSSETRFGLLSMTVAH